MSSFSLLVTGLTYEFIHRYLKKYGKNLPAYVYGLIWTFYIAFVSDNVCQSSACYRKGARSAKKAQKVNIWEMCTNLDCGKLASYKEQQKAVAVVVVVVVVA